MNELNDEDFIELTDYIKKFSNDNTDVMVYNLIIV